MTIRCIAVDDEPFALEVLKKDIRKVPFLDLVGTYTSPFDAREALRQDKIDLLFLDIQMPTLTGLQFVRSLPSPPLVILTTAYEQYALEGFDLNVVDYLVKPTPFERFLRAVSKAHDLFRVNQPEQLAGSMPLEVNERSFFFVHSGYREVKLFHDEILYVEGLKDYVKIFTTHQPTRPLLVRMNLKAIEAKLIPGQFCRIHHSFIVSLAHVTSFQRSKVFVGARDIPIGGRFAEEFEKAYRQNQ